MTSVEWEPDPTRTAPRDGDWVRVGDVEGRWHGHDDLTPLVYQGSVSVGNGRVAYIVKGIPVTVLREVAPPEPEWQPGDVVIDADGYVAQRSAAARWWVMGYSGPKPHEFLRRPLRRLVPEDPS